jgi:hypothetical protein
MRPSSARLLHTSVRISDLTFPASGILVPRTRAVFIHVENLISFAKRDRDGRVDGYLAGYLPEEVVLLFFRKGEVINAASIGPRGRALISIPEALRRFKSEPERSECCYAEASLEQLSWMYSACVAPAEVRFVDSRQPEQIFPPLAAEGFSGVLEFISQGRVNYLKFEGGRFVRGYLCDRPPGGSVVKYMESLFALRPDGTHPAIAGSLVAEQGEIPAQAPSTQVRVYRELFNRISLAIEGELPAEGRRKGERASAAVQAVHPVFSALTSSINEDELGTPISADALTASFADWTARVLEEVELVSPGSAERLIREATKDQRFVLQAAGFYEKLPWQVRW